MNEIEKSINNLIQSIEELDYYKILVCLKSLKEKDPELLALKRELKDRKKAIKLLKDDEVSLQKELRELKDLESRIDNHPLEVNYQAYKEKVLELLKPLFALFNK